MMNTFPEVRQGGNGVTGFFPYVEDRSDVPMSEQTEYGLAMIMQWVKTGYNGVSQEIAITAAHEWRKRRPDGIERNDVKPWAFEAEQSAQGLLR